MKAITVTAFDYSTLDKDVAGKLQSLAVQVRRGSMKVGEGGMEVGEAVFEAHKLLAGNGREGKFKAWVQDNGLSVSSAYECMYVYERSRQQLLMRLLQLVLQFGYQRIEGALIVEKEQKTFLDAFNHDMLLLGHVCPSPT